MARSTAHLPKRFAPYLRQAETEAAIRYGQPQQQLAALLQNTLYQANQNLGAANTANRETIGSLRASGGLLSQAYTNAGLTPQVIASIANSPTGQRIASELAAGQAGVIQQQNGAQAGVAYQRQHIMDQLRQDVGQINGQATELSKE